MSGRAIGVGDAIAVVGSVLREVRGEPVTVAASTRIDELDLDSLEIIEIFVRLEERTGYVATGDELRSLVTIGDVARLG
ncbi:MAG TPA: acyl carrier protein [Thermoleophilaceae bacterium]|nr:acyl carrier protein [Thermoleophilaceae bacterium]